MKKNVEKEIKKDKGVCENAPFKDLAEYKMVTYLEDDQINSQGS